MKCKLIASGFWFRDRIGVWVLGLLGAFFPGPSRAAEPWHFRLEEATIPDLQKAMEDGTVTSERLVRYYLNRIAAYDDKGPALNSIIAVNQGAIEAARALDEERRISGPRGPLHGIPIFLKDNYDTFDMPTTAGSLSLEGSIPPNDAFVVRKLREAGVVILGKNNLDEFARPCSGVGGLSSLGGQTRNPYGTSKGPGGSSGGTAVAIASNFAAAGVGTDTGGSIRGPASWQSLVGLRPTIGLTSRDGVLPLCLLRDVTGPLARSVVDAAIVLDAIAGPDPADPVTATSEGHLPASYMDFLDAAGLQGARIGIAGFWNNSWHDPEVIAVFDAAVAELEGAGAELVRAPDLSAVNLILSEHGYQIWAFNHATFHHEMNNYLESLGPEAPVHSVAEILASGRYLPCLDTILFNSIRADRPPEEDPEYPTILEYQRQMRDGLLATLSADNLDALAYVTIPRKPIAIGSSEGMLGNTYPSPWSGFPAITVPAGFTQDGFPVGIEFLGPAFSEGRLLRIAYAYEQATHHRRPPPSTPPLDCDEDGVPDEEEIAAGTEADINTNGIPDRCEPDCNSNGAPDDLDITSGTSEDCNGNGVPDECEPDCNSSGAPDDCDVQGGTSADCNDNGLPDECDIASGRSYDCNGGGVPDECEVSPFPAKLSANSTGIPDATYLGPPDDAREGLGNQSVTYDLAPASVADGPGLDLNVYEGTMEGTLLDPEFSSIDVLVSADGEEFLSVKVSEAPLVRLKGDESSGQDRLARSYNLAASGLASARYIRIQGLTAEPAGEGRGFDLDAVGILHLALCPPPPVLPEFRRGDSNADDNADISDAVYVLGHLFLGTAKPPCEKAADTNDDGKMDISDPVFLLGYLFLGSKAPNEPLGECGTDPTEDELTCESFPACR